MPTVAAPAWGVRWRIPIVLGVTVFVNFLDRNNLSLALPRIAQDFGWSDRQVGSNIDNSVIKTYLRSRSHTRTVPRSPRVMRNSSSR